MFNSFFQTDNTNYQAVLDDIRSGKAQLVDIREENEWDRTHFNGAVHVPLSKLAKGVGIDKLKQIRQSNKKIFLHCHTGSRVKMAEKMLAGFGCTEIKILPTTMNNMVNNGFELEY